MGTLNTTAGRNAKSGGEADFAEKKRGYVSFERVANVIKYIWPKKTASNVAYLAGVSERAVQFWLAGETRMTLENVVALLRTEAGYEILEAILGDECDAEWWVVTQTAQDVRKMRKEIKKQEDRIAARRAQLDMIDQFKK
jgi:alpha/beta superfamily hydrolase